MSKAGASTRWLWIGLLVALALCVRLALISQGPYHSDCLWLAIQSQKIIQTGQMHYLQSSGLPLTALAGALFVFLFQAAADLDRAVWAVNMMSVVFGSLTILWIYLSVENLCDELTARFAAALSALNPFLVGLSTFGNSHAVSLFFLLAALYWLQAYPRRGRTSDLLWAGVMLGAGGAARIQDLVALGIPFLLVMAFQLGRFTDGRGRAVRYLLAPWTVAGVIIVLAYAGKFFSGSGTQGEGLQGFVHTHLLAHVAPMSLSGYIAMFSRLLQTFSPIEWVLMLAGILILIKRQEKWTLLFLAAWVCIPMLLFGQLLFFVFRFLLPTVFALSVLAAVAAAELWQRRKWVRTVALSLVFCGVVYNATPYYQMFLHRHRHALLVDFFRWVNRVTESDAYVIERDHSAWVTHYAQRRFVDVDRSSPQSIDAFQARIDDLLQRKVPVYITKHGLLDRTDMFRRQLLDRYRLEYVGSHMIEDWHLGCLKQVIVSNDLLRIRLREI